MKIEPEFDAHFRSAVSGWQTVERARLSYRAYFRHIHRLIAARFRDLNIGDRSVTQNVERGDYARRRSDSRIDRGLQPVPADAPLYRFHIPREPIAEISATCVAHCHAALRRVAGSHRERRVGN